MDATAYRRAVVRQLVRDGATTPPARAAHPIMIDIAWDRPSIADIKATGATAVARYLSNDPTKNLRAQEVTDYTAAGLSVVTVWETTTSRATQGSAAGADDAKTALAQARSVGLPADQVIHLAVDTDTDWASVQPYFEGALSVFGSKAKMGAYGGIRVINGAHAWGLSKLWQTVAWSGGQVSPYATLYQYGATALNGAVDLNYVLAADFGQYPHPEGYVTTIDPADISVIAHAVADLLVSPAYRDQIAGTVKFWDLRAQDPTIPLPAVTGNIAVDSVTALRKVLAAQQAAQEKAIADALAGIPGAIQQALAEALVHVDVTVTGPAPTGA